MVSRFHPGDEGGRILNMATTVADPLRDLAWVLARLADTLEEDSSNSLELWRVVSL